jgi:membrane protein implicated in regulation of membrane protease activity
MIDIHFFWLIFAILCYLLEILTPSIFFLASIGTAALITFIFSLFVKENFFLWLIFFFASLLLVILTRPLAKRLTKKGVTRVAVDSLIGKKALVVESFNPVDKKGRVKVEGEEWLAFLLDEKEIITSNESRKSILRDEWVEIIGIEGTKLLVKKILESK